MTNPGYFMPPLIMPLMFYAAFAGALSSIAETPEFTYPDYSAFIFVFVLFMGACFAAVFTGFDVAGDLETGFARRMLVAAPRRMAIVAGFAIASLVQAALVSVVLFVIALATGMEIGGSVVQVLALFLMALILNLAVMLFTAGVALRLKSVQKGSIFMIMPVFVLLFVAPVYLARDQLVSWLKPAAGFNPLTALYEAGRGLLAGTPESVALAFAVCDRHGARLFRLRPGFDAERGNLIERKTL